MAEERWDIRWRRLEECEERVGGRSTWEKRSEQAERCSLHTVGSCCSSGEHEAASPYAENRREQFSSCNSCQIVSSPQALDSFFSLKPDRIVLYEAHPCTTATVALHFGVFEVGMGRRPSRECRPLGMLGQAFAFVSCSRPAKPMARATSKPHPGTCSTTWIRIPAKPAFPGTTPTRNPDPRAKGHYLPQVLSAPSPDFSCAPCCAYLKIRSECEQTARVCEISSPAVVSKAIRLETPSPDHGTRGD